MNPVALFSAVAVVVGNTAYHLCQKLTPHDVSPFASLAVSFAVASFLSLCLFVGTRGALSYAEAFGTLSLPSVALGVSCVTIEAGFLYAYRAGWNVGTAPVVFNAAVALFLLPIGAYHFGERLTWTHVAGVCFVLFGLFLLRPAGD